MTNLPLLSLLIGLPLLGALVLGLGQLKEQARSIAIGLSTLQLALLGYIYTAFDKTSGLFQFNESHNWFSISLGSMGQFMSKYTIGIDGLSISLILLTGLITWVALWNSTEIKEKIGGYYALVLLLNASIMGCFMAKDLFLFYVFFEFMLLPMYFLIGIWGGPRRNYASLKFFLYTLIGSLLILIVMLGMGVAYVDPYETALLNNLIRPEQDFNLEALKTVQQLIQSQELATSSLVHSFDMQALSDFKNCQITSILHIGSGWQLAGMSAREWGFWLLFIGFAIKLPMVPLHTWLPDAHVEAPTPISVLLAGVLLKIGAYGWLRITIPFFQIEALMAANILAVLGALSIIYGAYNALAMTDLKKLVAYSSVSHMGFVLLGIAAFTAEGWQGAIFQTISHGILSALLFLIVGVLYSRTGNREIDSYSGLVTLMPRFTVISGIAIFASLGLPGFSGFIGEFFSLLGAFSSPFIQPVIAVFGALGLLLGAGYLLWTFQKIYLGKHYQKNADWSLPDLNKLELISLFGLGIISILLGVYPGLLFELSEKFVTGLLK
ncbi:NuoM family protein [Aquirufa sp.]|jgi:NADH-quinone oxidoreductase subunit M|uniref:complex I subunit 4 family protein n=1 Tax=Aquirufa sp. TaxID=2676249 RepID=UPI003782D2E5